MDYRVNIKVRNARILRAMEAKGLTAKQLADAAEIGTNLLYRLINFQLSPYSTISGDVLPTAVRVCEVLNKMPCELWPDDMALVLERNTSEVDIDAAEVRNLLTSPDPLETALLLEKRAEWDSVLGELTDRERAVIERRFGLTVTEQTLEQVAAQDGVTRGRVRQIEKKALRKLRHPTRHVRLL